MCIRDRILSRPMALLVLSCLSSRRTKSSVIGSKVNSWGRFEFTAGAEYMWDLQDLSFCASLVPFVEKCSLRILAIDFLLQY